MKKYMLIIKDEEGTQHAHFYDDFNTADNARMDAEVSLGWYVELYEYQEKPEDGISCYEMIY